MRVPSSRSRQVVEPASGIPRECGFRWRAFLRSKIGVLHGILTNSATPDAHRRLAPVEFAISKLERIFPYGYETFFFGAPLKKRCERFRIGQHDQFSSSRHSPRPPLRDEDAGLAVSVEPWNREAGKEKAGLSPQEGASLPSSRAAMFRRRAIFAGFAVLRRACAVALVSPTSAVQPPSCSTAKRLDNGMVGPPP